MTSAVLKTAQDGSEPSRKADLGSAARAAELQAVNISPRTGLATDYLNHFNEAIMLLEMIPDMPDCAEDFLSWQPISYREHFAASNFRARELAIETYDAADPAIRREFDSITCAMSSILVAVGAAMRKVQRHKARATLAEQA